MSRRSLYEPALDLNSEDMKVELIPIPDTSASAESRADRVEILIAQIILLGYRRGRPKKEASGDIAA